jgi:hypothetical protein
LSQNWFRIVVALAAPPEQRRIGVEQFDLLAGQNAVRCVDLPVMNG